jgi:hypothetical protein
VSSRLLAQQHEEVVTAKISFFSESEQDVIVDFISCTDPVTGKQKDRKCAYSIRFENIAHVKPYCAKIEEK